VCYESADPERKELAPDKLPRFPACALIVMLSVLPVLANCGKAPADIAAFKERRTQCDHFRGEEPYDKAREKFLLEQLKQYCTGTDAELAMLRKKYARDAAAMKSLNAYEERIE
jgi:hypothetical protein